MKTISRGRIGGMLLCAGAAALTLSAMSPVEAASGKGKKVKPRPATVTAVSRARPFEKVTAPVRRGRWGEQVRLPGGSWIDCARDCRETLREQTVDIWEKWEQKGSDGGIRR